MRLAIRRKLGRVCPADVHEAMELPQEALLSLLAACPDVPFAAACRSFIASRSHNSETVLATAQGHMRCYRHRDLAASTSAPPLEKPKIHVL